MSIAIKIPPVEIALPASQFAECPPQFQDIDGNTIDSDRVGSDIIFTPAEFTTCREIKHFVSTRIAPYVADEFKDKIQVDIPNVQDECDKFKAKFTLTLRITQDFTQVVQ